ncbi:MAG: hypothetical protein HY648_04755 [Acidobacteria bacterium]|nr:hypothetical protein [Acidobacteriota bacterium]
MPQQVTRLAVVFLVLAGALIAARRYLIPETFGESGHFRAAAIRANTSRPLAYAGSDECAACHSDVVDRHDQARHKTVACEVCHGAAASHVEAPLDYKPPAPRERGYCPLCHGYNSSRPTGFPQIDPVTHNPVQPCIACHDPHEPVPPRVPQECSACHGEIARTKGFSSHATLACTQCHEVRDEHKVNPRRSAPSKPQTREFCGQCHAKDAKSPPEIPRIDLASHWTAYVCWQCHYSHYPEVP